MQDPKQESQGFGMPQPQQPAPAGPQPTANPTIYTMPEKFMGSSGGFRASTPAAGGGGGAPAKRPASGSRLVLIVAIAALVLGGLTFGVYLFLNSSGSLGGFFGSKENSETPPESNTNTNVPLVQPNENTAPVNQNENTNTTNSSMTPRERDAKRLADLITIADALDQYFTQSSNYPTFLSQLPSAIIAEVPRDPATGDSYVYVATGDRQSYEIVFDIEESVDFKGQTWNRGTYRLKPVDFKEGSSDVPVEPVPETPPGSIDADSDGLTAAEESLMQTSPQNPDTDADGYPDGTEITNFYSPLQSGAIKLDETGLVRLFESSVLNLSFYYPTSWTVNALEDAQEVLVTTATGEYISLQVKDNPQSKTSWDWYVENVSGDFNKNSVNIITIAGHEAVSTLDGLAAYVAVGTRVIVVQYNKADAPTINYPSLFTFILNRLVVN